ncbi:MAG: hypothetical protein ACTSYR_05555 [Candidatus Odinarchaeia archaeon]
MSENKTNKINTLGFLAIIGCVLFTLGIGLAFYNQNVTATSNSLYALSLENNYQVNISLSFDANDRVIIQVSPFEDLNYSITVYNPSSTILQENLSGKSIKLISLVVNETDSYIISISELSTYKYSLISIRVGFLSSKLNPPFLMLSIPIIISGIFLSFIGLKEINLLRKKTVFYYDFSPKELLLTSGTIVSFILQVVVLNYFIDEVALQDMFGIIIVIITTLFNIIITFTASNTLKGNKLWLFSIMLLGLSFIWPIITFLILSYSKNIIFEYLFYGILTDFSSLMDLLVNYSSVYFQLAFFILTISLLYFTIGVNQGKEAVKEILNFEEKFRKEKFYTLTVLKTKLLKAVKKTGILAFFKELSDFNLEASAVLYLMLKEYALNNNNQFTYHKLISEHRDIFNKKLYERNPVEEILEPLELVEKEVGRFKVFKLNTRNNLISKILEKLENILNTDELSHLETIVGLDKIRERKIRFSGLS